MEVPLYTVHYVQYMKQLLLRVIAYGVNKHNRSIELLKDGLYTLIAVHQFFSAWFSTRRCTFSCYMLH